jgi:hypothetical protein
MTPLILTIVGFSAAMVEQRRRNAVGDPANFAATTTALILAGAAVAGTAVSAVGAYSQGQAQKASAEFNAKVAQNNAQAATQQAGAEAQMIRQRGERLRGAQAAALAKAGVSGGSAGDVVYDSATQNELEALMTQYRGHVEAGRETSQSQLFQSQAGYAGRAGAINAGSTAISGLANAGWTYSSIRNNQPDYGYW